MKLCLFFLFERFNVDVADATYTHALCFASSLLSFWTCSDVVFVVLVLCFSVFSIFMYYVFFLYCFFSSSVFLIQIHTINTHNV